MQFAGRLGFRLFSTVTRRPPFSGATCDVVIVGSGLLGTSAGVELLSRYPNLSVSILEKDEECGLYQSRTKFGVIHPGIFEVPGSLKAKTCIRGNKKIFDYLSDRNIPHQKHGMLIVAKNQNEEFRLDEFYDHSQKNGCKDVVFLSGDKIKEIEPHCAGTKALFSPHSGAVDFLKLNEELLDDFKKRGGYINYRAIVSDVVESDDPDYPVLVKSFSFDIKCKYALVCAGAGGDLIAEQSNVETKDFTMVPVLSSYLMVHPDNRDLVQGNIFKVHSSSDPFPMMNFSKVSDGLIMMGPNFFFSPQRFYLNGIEFHMIYRQFTAPAFSSYVANYFPLFLKSCFFSTFLRAGTRSLQSCVPDLKYKDVFRCERIINYFCIDKNGKIIEDYIFAQPSSNIRNRVVHVLNTPPIGGACMGITDELIDLVQMKFELPDAEIKSVG